MGILECNAIYDIASIEGMRIHPFINIFRTGPQLRARSSSINRAWWCFLSRKSISVQFVHFTDERYTKEYNSVMWCDCTMHDSWMKVTHTMAENKLYFMSILHASGITVHTCPSMSEWMTSGKSNTFCLSFANECHLFIGRIAIWLSQQTFNRVIGWNWFPRQFTLCLFD